MNTDILWRNESDNALQIWLMDGNKVTGRVPVLGENGSQESAILPWRIIAVGDFNRDGNTDILWRNESDNDLQIWLMDGNKVTGRVPVLGENGNPEFAILPWRIIGVGDFNRDGNTDILWRNESDNALQIWLMDGNKVTGRVSVLGENGNPEFAILPWNIVGAVKRFHVSGAIRDKYNQLGGPNSWLGRPTSDEIDFSEGGRVSTFEHGAIYWWPDTGAIELGNIALRYKGLYCFGETDELSASDEPYVVFGIVPAPPGQTSDVTTQIYDDVDAGDARPDLIELYRGLPHGALLGLALMEHDEGDPNKYREQIKMGADKVGTAVASGCGALLGPEAAPVCKVIWDKVAPEIVEFVNKILGTDDDVIEKYSWVVSAKDMVIKAHAPLQNFWGIEYHLESKLLSDGEASYKVYLDILAV